MAESKFKRRRFKSIKCIFIVLKNIFVCSCFKFRDKSCRVALIWTKSVGQNDIVRSTTLRRSNGVVSLHWNAVTLFSQNLALVTFKSFPSKPVHGPRYCTSYVNPLAAPRDVFTYYCNSWLRVASSLLSLRYYYLDSRSYSLLTLCHCKRGSGHSYSSSFFLFIFYFVILYILLLFHHLARDSY